MIKRNCSCIGVSNVKLCIRHGHTYYVCAHENIFVFSSSQTNIPNHPALHELL